MSGSSSLSSVRPTARRKDGRKIASPAHWHLERDVYGGSYGEGEGDGMSGAGGFKPSSTMLASKLTFLLACALVLAALWTGVLDGESYVRLYSWRVAAGVY
mmetsp:Transcript_35551/g.95439  ORF Transcript_35551/g.95439 Transcript_35551/m.95439 type:complete len:101 (-) Transcript_35551:233-535(-)